MIGDGTSACNFTVGGAFTLTATVDISASGTLTLSTTGLLTGIIFGTLSAGSTVNYAEPGGQTGIVTSYSNLTLSGSGTKTFATAPTVNGILSLEGTAIITVSTGVVTYGANASLKYNTSTSRTASAEEWISPFVATGGVTIENTGAITIGVAKVFNAGVPLSIGAGATLTPGANLITLGGNFNNQGTLTSGSGGITITGTATSQSIDEFSTTGALTISKTAGTVTLVGNTNAASLTFSASGATLSVSNSLTITNSLTLNNAAAANFSASVTGSGTLSCASLVIGNNTSATSNNSTYTHTLISSVATLNISGNLTINSYFLSTNRIRNGVFSHSSGIVNIDGSVITANANGSNNSSYVMGNSSPILNLSGATPFTISGTGTSTITLNGAGARVNYDGSVAQPVFAVTYNDLIFSGSAAKSIATGTSVTGNLSIAPTGTATASIGTGLTINVGSLTLASLGTNSGYWGSTTASTATYKNNTYFAATTGRLNVGSATWQTPTVTPTIGSYTYSGSGQGPNTATNTGTGSTYTFIYSGISGTTYGPSSLLPTIAGSYTVTATVGASTDGLYNQASSIATSFVISAANVAVSATAKGKIYGDTDPVLTYTFSPALQSGDSFSGALTRAAGESVGNYEISQGNLTLSSNYTLTYTPANLTISQRPLTITASNQTKTYGSTLTFAGSEFTSTGLQNGETIGSVNLSSTGSPATVAVNSYSIIPSAATGGTFTASNYSITYSNGTISVGKAVLTVTAENKTVTYGDAVPVLTYTMTGFFNGDNQTSAVTGLPGLTTSYTANTQVSTSPVVVYASIGTLTSGNYDFSFGSGSININQKELKITAQNLSKCFKDVGSFSGNEFTPAGLINGDTVNNVTLTSAGTVAGANPNTYDIIPSAAVGTGLNNYDIKYVNGTYTVSPLPATGEMIVN